LESFALHSKYSSLSLSTKSSSRHPISSNLTKNGRKLIVIQDPPFQNRIRSNMNNESNREKEHALFDYLLSFDCPVIMILSGLNGQDDMNYLLDKCIPPNVRNRYYHIILILLYDKVIIMNIIGFVLRAFSSLQSPRNESSPCCKRLSVCSNIASYNGLWDAIMLFNPYHYPYTGPL